MKLAGQSLDPQLTPAQPSSDLWKEAYQTLLEAAIKHAVQTEPQLYKDFCAEIMRRAGEGSEQGAVIADLLKVYNAAVQSAVAERQAQVYSALHRAFEALKVVNQSDGEWTNGLDALQDRLDQLVRVDETTPVKDLRDLRGSFQEWLHGVKDHLARRKQSNSELLDSMRERVVVLERLLDASVNETRTALAKASPAEEVDPVTALGTKSTWDRALATEMLSPENLYVAAFAIESLAGLTRRFGNKVAEQILFLASRHVSNSLKVPGDRVFRLDGPNFVALLRRESSLPQVQHEVHAISFLKLEHEFTLPGDGVAFVMASLRARAFPVCETSVQDLHAQLAQFFQ